MNLAATGRTGDLDEIAGTMLDLHEGRSAEEFAERHTYLAVTDPGAAIEALWHIVTEHDAEVTVPLAHAAAANPVLCRAWPWISHGTLNLYDRRDRPSLVKRGLAFHPAVGGFMVRSYDGETHAAEPTEAAVLGGGEVIPITLRTSGSSSPLVCYARRSKWKAQSTSSEGDRYEGCRCRRAGCRAGAGRDAHAAACRR